MKDQHLTEKHIIQFRAEFFNIAQSPEFNNPGVTQNTSGYIRRNQSTVTNPRIIQLGLKYIF